MKFMVKSLTEYEEKERKKSFSSKEEINVFAEIELKISWWSVLLIVKMWRARGMKKGEEWWQKDKFDSITESLGRLTIGIIHKLMDAGWINYEFILTSLAVQFEVSFAGVVQKGGDCWKVKVVWEVFRTLTEGGWWQKLLYLSLGFDNEHTHFLSLSFTRFLFPHKNNSTFNDFSLFQLWSSVWF